MTSISSISHLTLDLPPSCIAFCPTQPEHFVVGTYYLHPKQEKQNTADGDEDGSAPADGGDETRQRRSGSLILYQLIGDSVYVTASCILGQNNHEGWR